MNLQYVLRKLAEVMSWDDDTAQAEFARIELMSRLKYDGYQDFLAGARFAERLLDWVQQFEEQDRHVAYGFVRDRLIFISTAEMNHLVELSWPESFRPPLERSVARRFQIPNYRVRSHAAASKALRTLQRRCLFIELSDGARIDVFRRANAGVISNEQIVTTSRFNKQKWDDLRKDLREEQKDSEALFEFVFLLDDFTASGTSLLRKVDGDWKGKLCRFWNDSRDYVGTHLSDDFRVYVHHYLATEKARNAVATRHAERMDEGDWFNAEFTFGMVLPGHIRVEGPDHEAITDVISRHYDPAIAPEEPVRQSGYDTMEFGYGDGRLPLVLDHNTPNNTIPLLWAFSDGGDGVHQMRPLFPRRQRHDVLDELPE